MSDLKKYNKHSETWCPVPFNAVSIHPMGFLSRCMMSEEVMSNADEMDWNNPEFQRLRQSMLEGKWDLPGCDNCRVKEEIGMKSQRQNWLSANLERKFNFPDDVYDNADIIGNKIRHLFLNFNNVCNFKCRMCSPRYSNSLIPEFKQLSQDVPEVKFEADKYKNINNVVKFIEANKDNLQDLRSIWITGGEPFIDNSIWQVMDILNEYADVSKIHMTITTNGSRTDINDVDKFKNFKQLHWDLSIDAVGPMFEYMRSAGVYTWDQMNSNIQDLSNYVKDNHHWLMVSLNSSYQVYNAHKLDEFFTYIRDMFGAYHSINSRVLVGPRWFQAKNVPDNIKSIANENINKLLQQSWLIDREIDMIKDCQKMLNKEFKQQEWNTFVQQCKSQDKFRGVNLSDYDSLLAQEIYK